jgi:hypothetical protein
MDRLLLKTSNLGIGNGAYVHSLVTSADGNVIWQQDDGRDFNFIVQGNLISKNLGTGGGELVLANLRANNATVSQVSTANVFFANVATIANTLTIQNANVFSANNGTVRLGNCLTVSENATVAYGKALSLTGNLDAASVTAGGVDLKARIDAFMKSTTRIYVKTTGDDANDGRSWDAALKTIARAAVLATSGTTIYVETGTYVENNPIRFNPYTAIIGDNLRRTILVPQNPRLDFFHVDNLCYVYGLRFVNLKRPAFSVAFPCAIAEVTVSGGSVTSVEPLYSPTGYTEPPPVIIEAPESSSTTATATATISNGAITAITVTSGGSGYSAASPPAVTIDPPSSSSGSQAYATAVVDANGTVSSIVIPVGGGGNGYSVTPTVTIGVPTATVGITANVIAQVSGGVITGYVVDNGGTGYSVTLSRPHVSVPAPSKPFITGSPYIQNCSSITGPFKKSDGGLVNVTQSPYNVLPYSLADIDEIGAGGGCRIDGAVVAQAGDTLNGTVLTVSSPLRSFVADSFTQVNQGGPGHLVINRGYAQFVSCFTTFSSYSYRSVAGGLTNISTSVTDFGNYGLVASGYWSVPIATSVVSQNYRSTVASVTIATGNGGKGYTRAPYVQFGYSDSTARGLASLDADRVASVTITSGGTYLVTPSVTFVQNASDVTLSIANPAVVSWTNHGLPLSTAVYLRTTGTLPTGLVANTVYYTFATATNSFQLSSDKVSAIATTGTQSGIHTMFTALTMTIASPCTLTWSNHGLVANTSVAFTTTGTFPTNITANTTYYVGVANITTHTFEIAATAGGLPINTSGTQSGIHTMTTSQAARGTVSMTSPSPVRISGVSGRKPDYGSVAKLDTKWYTVTGATLVSSGVYDITFYPLPLAANAATALNFYQASQVTTGQHVTEYVGSGVTYNALPEYGGIPNQSQEVLAISPGKVYYSIATHQGSQSIGPYFKVDQLSGTVTLNTDRFNLSGLGSIGPFKRDGNPVGVELKEVSPNPFLQASTGAADGYTVPTQSAVKTYVDARSIPDGGATNQALIKTSATARDVTWASVVLTANVNQPNGVPSLDGSSRIVGNGSIIYDISATNLTLGTLPNARLPNEIGTTNTIYYGSGQALSLLNAGNVALGTLNNLRLPSTIGTATTAFVGNALALSAIPVANLSATTGTGNAVLDIAPVFRTWANVSGNAVISNVLYMNNQVVNNIICLYGDTNPASTNVYGLGVNASTLRYNSAANHTWYANVTNTMTLSSTGTLTATTMTASTFTCSADTVNAFTNGSLVMRGTSPTIRFQHSTANTAFLHCNSNLLYVLRGGNDATTWTQISGQWPMYWNLINNDGVCGGNLSAIGDVTAAASDERLKSNVRVIDHALDAIKQLRGVRFEWRDDTPQPMRGTDVGLIAQDVLRAGIPEAIKPAPFDTDEVGASRSGQRYLTVDKSKIIALLVEAVKELASEIESLKSLHHSNTG